MASGTIAEKTLALAAAEDQQIEMAVAGIRLRAAHAEDGGANRIAGEMTFRALVVRKIGHLGEGGGNFSRVRGKEPFARPSTAFCSCSTTGTPRKAAARTVGTEG